MKRSAQQNKAAHALLGDFARSWSHEGVRLTAAEWKVITASYFNAALAEADGLEVRDIPLPESTSRMDAARMNNFIEYVTWLSVCLDVELGSDTEMRHT